MKVQRLERKASDIKSWHELFVEHNHPYLAAIAIPSALSKHEACDYLSADAALHVFDFPHDT